MMTSLLILPLWHCLTVSAPDSYLHLLLIGGQAYDGKDSVIRMKLKSPIAPPIKTGAASAEKFIEAVGQHGITPVHLVSLTADRGNEGLMT